MLYIVDILPGRDLSGIVREIGALSGVTRVECEQPSFYA
jgi:hypothetical protein